MDFFTYLEGTLELTHSKRLETILKGTRDYLNLSDITPLKALQEEWADWSEYFNRRKDTSRIWVGITPHPIRWKTHPYAISGDKSTLYTAEALARSVHSLDNNLHDITYVIDFDLEPHQLQKVYASIATRLLLERNRT